VSVIAPRRLFDQADAEQYGLLLDVLDDRQDGGARSNRVGAGTAAVAKCRVAAAADDGHVDGAA